MGRGLLPQDLLTLATVCSFIVRCQSAQRGQLTLPTITTFWMGKSAGKMERRQAEKRRTKRGRRRRGYRQAEISPVAHIPTPGDILATPFWRRPTIRPSVNPPTHAKGQQRRTVCLALTFHLAPSLTCLFPHNPLIFPPLRALFSIFCLEYSTFERGLSFPGLTLDILVIRQPY